MKILWADHIGYIVIILYIHGMFYQHVYYLKYVYDVDELQL